MSTLKQHRMARGMSQWDLARKIRATAAAVSNWETGKYVPSARLIPRLAKALHIDALELTKIVDPVPDQGQR